MATQLDPQDGRSGDVTDANRFRGTPAADEAAPARQKPYWGSDDEAATYAGVSSKLIRQEIRSGHLRGAVVDRRGTIRILIPTWVDAWLECRADERALANPPDGRRSNVRDFKSSAAGDCNHDGNEVRTTSNLPDRVMGKDGNGDGGRAA